MRRNTESIAVLILLIITLLTPFGQAFVTQPHSQKVVSRDFSPSFLIQRRPLQGEKPVRSTLHAEKREDNDSKRKTGLEEGVRSKLVSESIAPWRTLRLFAYISLGSGAALGGIITLTGTLAALAGNRPDLDLNTEYLNLAIDFGAVALFALFYKLDKDKEAELNVKVEKRIERKKEQSDMVKNMRAREKRMGDLLLEIQVSSNANDRTSAKVSELQKGARQNMILVAGPREACRDALVGANLLRNDFPMRNILVIPYEIKKDNNNDSNDDKDEDGKTPVSKSRNIKSTMDGSGFGDGAKNANNRPSFEMQPYVARPVGEGWDQYVAEEMEDAIKQSGKKCKTEGIVIVMDDTGKVVRRGVGRIPWRETVESLADASLNKAKPKQLKQNK